MEHRLGSSMVWTPGKTDPPVLETLAPLTTPSPQQPVVPSDEELVGRAREGDRRAFRLLVERYEDAVTATVVAMLGPTGEVDDVAQEVINRSLDALRRRKRSLARFLSRDDETHHVPEPALEEEERLEDRERARLVHEAIGALPPKHRAVVILRLIEGYSTEETAAILEIPYGTVLSRLSRAHAKLKSLLTPYIQEHLSEP